MRATWHHVVLLLAVVFVLYAPSTGYEFLFEDKVVLQALPVDGAPVAEEGQPVWRAVLSSQKDAFGGDNPKPFRFLNIVLLFLAALAFYLFLRQPAMGTRRIPAFLAALVLATHPIASASVYQVCEGQAMLLGLVFMLLALTFYIRGGWVGAIGAALAYLMALGATEQALWLPGALAVAEGVGLAGWKGFEDDRGRGTVTSYKLLPKRQLHARQWARLIPVLLVAALYLVWRRSALGGMVLAPSVPASMPVFEWIYGWKVLAMPRRVVLFQPTLEAWFTSWRMVAALGLMAVVAGVVATALRHPEATPAVRRSEERRRVMLWVALMVCLFPALTGWLSGRIPFDEQRQLAFIMPILGLLAWVVSRFWSLDLFRREAMVVGLGLAVVLFAISLARRDHFVNDNTFVSHWARNNPRVWETLARRAEAWAGAGRYSAAERQVERGLMLKPDEPGLLVVREAIEEKTGRLEAALVTLNSLSIAEPTNLVHQVKTADVQFKLGRYREAGDIYEALLQTAPEDAGLKEKLEASRKAVQPPNS